METKMSKKKEVICPTCNGSGEIYIPIVVNGENIKTCPTCNGSGTISR